MDIFDVITLGGGLAFFLYGMNQLGAGLEKVSGGRMEKMLEKLTSNVVKSVLLGLIVTAAIQSSSATTVIVVGLVNAGILKLRNAVGVIMGANIGTTVTAQILRLGGNEDSPNLVMQFLNPKALAPMIAIAGIIMIMVAKRNKFKDIGSILVGFGILFQGMFIMEGAVSGLKDVPEFQQLFVSLQNPILGVLVGAVVTGIIQSSSASVGILQALSSTGAITFSAAFPIIMGQNIGTCVTPLLASIGANKNAKRAAMVHLYFNIIGTVLFLIAVYSLQYLILPGGFSFWNDAIYKDGIANFHTLFNVVCTLLFMPFAGLFAKLAEFTVRGSSKSADRPDEDVAVLDDRLLVSPSLALEQCQATVVKMGEYASYNFRESMKLFHKYDSKAVERIREFEDSIDRMEDRLGNYLLKLTDRELTDHESKDVTQILHIISEFERVGDYSINLMELAHQMYEQGIKFSDKAYKELDAIGEACGEIIQMALVSYRDTDLTLAKKVEPLEETIDIMVETLKYKHIERLKNGKCTIEAGINFLESLTNLERISDHCSNIGVYIIGHNFDRDTLNRHEYLKAMHKGDSEDYAQDIEEFKQKYYVRIQ